MQTCPYSSDLLTEVSHCVFPWWAVLATIVPAIPYTILVYLEDNITSGLIEKPENNLKKGGPYDYLDTTITAVITLLMSCLGMPWVSAMYIRSFYHLQALSVIEDVYKPYGVFDERFIEVSETRVPGIVLGLLFYCVFFFDRALSVIPEAWDPTNDALTCRLFYGLLLYMGASLFISDGLFPGIRLIFMDRDLYIDDYRKRVALLAFDFILAPSTKNQPLYHRTGRAPPHSILSQIVY